MLRLQSYADQLLALVAMEPPDSFDSKAVRDEKAKVLHAIQALTHEDVLTDAVRGQYGAGEVDGQVLVGYREEPDIPLDSSTETFAAVKLDIDNWHWSGVPFYLRSGKALPKRLTEIVIQFREVHFAHPAARGDFVGIRSHNPGSERAHESIL